RCKEHLIAIDPLQPEERKIRGRVGRRSARSLGIAGEKRSRDRQVFWLAKGACKRRHHWSPRIRIAEAGIVEFRCSCVRSVAQKAAGHEYLAIGEQCCRLTGAD